MVIKMLHLWDQYLKTSDSQTKFIRLKQPKDGELALLTILTIALAEADWTLKVLDKPEQQQQQQQTDWR